MAHGADRLKAWLTDQALPLWADRGVDGRGGFVEQLDLEGRPEPDAVRRIRVQARQIYTYAHAQTLGLGTWTDLILRGVDWMTTHGWDKQAGGFHHRLDGAGAPVDTLKDTYDHAFVLLGLAWALKATGESGLRDWIAKTLDVLDTRLKHPAQPGFLEGAPASLPRRQNPHMHLLEAHMALFDATGDSQFLDRAQVSVGLFHDVFYDAATGTLGEFFTDDWQVADGEAGAVIEPGHHFEWVFLLNEYHARAGGALPEAAGRLFEVARAHGLDAQSGLAVDEIWRDGRLKKATKRCWPQTEAIRAHQVMAGLQRIPAADVDAFVERLFTYYIDPAPDGTWLDVMGEDNRPVAKSIPASTFYHVFSAYAALDEELTREAPAAVL